MSHASAEYPAGVLGLARRTSKAKAAVASVASRADAFPHTRRPLPWLLAAFIAIVFLVPIDATELKVHLGVNSHPDRFVVILLVGVWIWLGGDQRAFMRTRRSKLFLTAAGIFFFVAVASVVFNAPRIIMLGEFELAEKQFGLLISLMFIGWFALTALRYEDLRGFCSYMIGLGTLMAVGLLVERQTGYNVFYELARKVLQPIANVKAAPTSNLTTGGVEGRVNIVGPTLHPLAVVAMLMMVMPFALLRITDAKSRKEWWLNGLALMLMLVAAMETERKTAIVVPLAVVLYVAIYRPRQILRLVPVGTVALIAAVHFAAPGTLGTILNLGAATHSSSTAHREGDISGVLPDILKHPILGRGYGSVNIALPSQFRVNDDEYVDEARATGIVGLVAFLWMIISPIVLARASIRRRGSSVSGFTVAASAGCVAFLVVSILFDSMGFTEAPYTFFLVAALTTIAAAGPEGNVVSLRELVRRRRAAPES